MTFEGQMSDDESSVNGIVELREAFPISGGGSNSVTFNRLN